MSECSQGDCARRSGTRKPLHQTELDLADSNLAPNRCRSDQVVTSTHKQGGVTSGSAITSNANLRRPAVRRAYAHPARFPVDRPIALRLSRVHGFGATFAADGMLGAEHRERFVLAASRGFRGAGCRPECFSPALPAGEFGVDLCGGCGGRHEGPSLSGISGPVPGTAGPERPSR